jgi:hypothetical protein
MPAPVHASRRKLATPRHTEQPKEGAGRAYHAGIARTTRFPRTIEWKGAIVQPGPSECSFGAAGEEIFYGQQATTTPRPARRAREIEREAHVLPTERGVWCIASVYLLFPQIGGQLREHGA